MITLTKREWNLLKYPTYPDIQFISQGRVLQVQTMVKIDDDDYYLPCIIAVEIVSNEGLRTIAKMLDDAVLDILEKYEVDETNDNLHKIIE